MFGWFLEFSTGYNPFPDARIRFNGESVEMRFIFDDEWVRLYKSADAAERLILALGATMGIRRAEMVSIEMDDIRGDKIHVMGKGSGRRGKVEIMVMSDLVRRDLGTYLEYREGILSKYGDRSRGCLLISTGTRSIGMPMSVGALQTVLERLAERSGVPFSPIAFGASSRRP